MGSNHSSALKKIMPAKSSYTKIWRFASGSDKLFSAHSKA